MRTTALTGLMGILLLSCGSYEQASYYDRDGIYNRGTERVVATESRVPQAQAQATGDDFYQNYFGEKSRELDEFLESEIFTDPDAYSSTGVSDSLRLAQDGQAFGTGDYFQESYNDYAGSPGWGDGGGNVSINLYGGWGGGWGWNDPFWGWGAGWGWGPGWGWGWGPGWGWGAGWGWGWGPGWGWGFPGSRYAGFTNGRRGFYGRYNNINALGSRSVMAAGNAYRTTSGRSNIDRSGGRYSSVRTNQSRDAAARNTAYRSSRSSRAMPKYSTSSRSARTYTGNPRSYYDARSGTYSRGATRSGAPNTYSGRSGTYSRQGASPGVNYRSSGTRGYSSPSGTYRSSGGSSRSSGSYRSSGGSSRSSGSFRGSSGGSRSSGGMRGGGGGGRSSGGGRSGGRGNQ